MLTDNFETDRLDKQVWEIIGRGNLSLNNGILLVEDCYVTTTASEWSDYSFQFRGRTPAHEDQVQIWAGFRHFNRDFRYVAALRGGNNNHLYLARYGAEGFDRFLDIEPLDFKPVTGKWYDLKIVVAGPTIAVYLGDEEEPRLLAEDPEAPFRNGGVSLGGSYLATEFTHVKVAPVEKNCLNGVHRAQKLPIVSDKEAKRQKQRELFKPFVIDNISDDRSEFSLNGNWLFLPDNKRETDGSSALEDDTAWHVMDVPNLWGPARAWLEGETFQNGKFNKGMNDTFHQLEKDRCDSYTFNWGETESAWYRNTLVLPDGIDRKQLVLHFEGVSYISEVYINGIKLHENRGMFGPFDVDISRNVKPGRNIIAVHVNRVANSPSVGSGDLANDTIDANYAAAWDIIEHGSKGKVLQQLDEMELPRGFLQGTPGGIWKPVTLIISEKVKIEETFFNPSMDSAHIDVWYKNSGDTDRTATLNYTIIEKSNGTVLCDGTIEEVKLKAGERRKVSFSTPEVSAKLWAPGEPNLYNLKLVVTTSEGVDTLTETVGFRTVATEGNRVIFNGKPLWIRGANHMPAHIRPNDENLAKKFMKLALEHNVIATRTHGAPFSKNWMKAADESGVMVSYEGTWPWLMLRGNDVPPEEATSIWLDDMERLFKANRNHPSIFLWTVNNEMKFLIYAAGKVLKAKGALLNRAMKTVRNLDPSRPVVADSAYFRKVAYYIPRLSLIMNKIDDGDIDDPHIYSSWYENSFYHLVNGEFSKMYAMKNRPLISQEAGTGYPRADDGLPTRVYLFYHQTPQTWVGKDAYEHSDPKYFQERHAMLTKGTIETIRRVDHTKISGVMPFAFETWFYHQHDYKKVTPMETAKKIRMTFQPILASMDLQILHYYAGGEIKSKLALLNDDKDHPVLEEPVVNCEVRYNGKILSKKVVAFDNIPYYNKAEKDFGLTIPENLPSPRIDVELRLIVESAGKPLSENSYKITLADKSWALPDKKSPRKYVTLKIEKEVQKLLDFLGFEYRTISKIGHDNIKEETLLIGNRTRLKSKQINQLKKTAAAGGNIIMLNSGKSVLNVFPDLVTHYNKAFHEIVNMNIKESPVFADLDPLDISWFPYKPYKKKKAGYLDAYVPESTGLEQTVHKLIYKVKVPHVAIGRYTVNRFDPDVSVLAEALLPHGYLSDPQQYKDIGGSVLFDIKLGKGSFRVSSIRFDAVDLDPIAAKLMGNVLKI
ncbi:glycoside hydrolase family 2 protein [Spirochaeta isovalerica]|uniref:Beta-galactosidase n=1 Tax=Spirochaeta isovalerica TaxID=150 RepID=A0A841R9A2_9SPIO|nr:glycoside hydrolase family 2 TIM barrel-domain containing protein [Spirochaeta isovalerica]MBB6479941.1 hypothetical protein [Spirochaeta isovalerica]